MRNLTASMMGRATTICIATLLVLLASCGPSFAQTTAAEKSSKQNPLYFPPNQGDWEHVAPDQVGWDKAKLEAALEFAGNQNSSGVVVLYRGRILAEQYWQPAESFRYKSMLHGDDGRGHQLEDVASIQKSVAATLLGVAKHKGLLKLDDSVDAYLGEGWSRASASEEAKITLRHLITMTTGLNDRLEYEVPAGKRWKYNTNAYSRIINVIEAASKMERNELTQQWLAGPIGMEKSTWVVRPFARKDPKTNRHGFATSARELARFGLLIQAKGNWKGAPVIKDREYLETMLQPSQKLNPSYGYLWWLNGQSHTLRAASKRPVRGSLMPVAPKDLVAGLGAMGRKVYVVPSLQLVVTRLGSAPGKSFDAGFWKRLIAAAPQVDRVTAEPDLTEQDLVEAKNDRVTASGKLAESELDPFLGKPQFDLQTLFRGERFPNIAVATDGTVIATWGTKSIRARRSEDGGKTWGDTIEIANPGFQGGGLTVDEKSGDVLTFVEANHPPAALSVYRSKDHGQTWQIQDDVVLNPDRDGNLPSMHMNEHGITLRHGKHAGRLVRASRWYAGKNEASRWPKHFTNAIYSDDGGKTWNTSAPFPANGTGEATLAELSDGRIYYNSRRHWAPEGSNPLRRWTALSNDGGATWDHLAICDVLPDGPQDNNYGCMAGLTRLPVFGRDILIYSNCESPKGRHHGTVWASFDGGQTWPLKRLVYEGRFAYSSMTSGRPGTDSEGWIYLNFEGGPDGGSTVARFNLSWLLKGTKTDDGTIPNWLSD